MIGAIIGDIVGSRFEWDNIKTKAFELFTPDCSFTDDSVMTLAVAQAILNSGGDLDTLEREAVACMRALGKRYPLAGYGGKFTMWLLSKNPKPYNSFGNGSAMRVSPCGFAAKTLDEAIAMADAVTAVTHNHPEGLKGAEATAAAIFLARSGKTKEEIRAHIEQHYYRLDFTLDEIRPTYTFDVSCQGSVPQALEAFFESESFEDAIHNAISIGGDSDTIAAITGGIAEAFYGVPEELLDRALTFLDDTQMEILCAFKAEYLPDTLCP